MKRLINLYNLGIFTPEQTIKKGKNFITQEGIWEFENTIRVPV